MFPVVLASLVLLFTAASAQDISGSLTGTLGPGTYTVVGNCQVDAGQTLTIQPGTTFLFAGHFSLKVYGTLNAVGTEADSIYFLRQQQTSTCEWSGVRFMAGSSPNSMLSYAYMEYAKYHTYPDYNGGAIFIGQSGVTITDCYIKDCYASAGGGIYVESVSATISDCFVMTCEAGNGGGMYINNSQNVLVQNSAFVKNRSTST